MSREYEFPPLPLGCYVETSRRGVKFETYSKAGVLAYTKSCIDPLLSEIDRLTRELAEVKARALPDGWVAVPVEPTAEMIHSACAEHGYPSGGRWTYRDGYRAMLDALPKLPPNGLPSKESGNEDH